jgi:cysteine desulfurase
MMLKLPVYLDYNATTPCDARVVEAMLPYFTENFGNAASRTHYYGWQAEEAVELAREQVAALIGSEPKEIVFTSGATESDNLALKGVFEAYASKGNHIITCVTEHKAVLDTCKQLEKKGARVTYLPVNRDGLVDTGELESAIDTHTILIALMFANNELGVIQPVKAIGEIARKHGVLFFTDAAQAVGKIPVSVNEWGIDILSLSAHKMYGPKGVGAIYMRRKNPRVKLQAQIEGGGHERAVRSGTLNVPGIVGLGKACELARKEMEADSARLSQLRDKLERILLEEGDVYINGNQFNRLPHVSNIGFGSASGEALMLACNKDIAVSSGSACSSASMEPSYVLKAIGLSDEEAYGSLRFSLGRFTTEEEIDHVARVLITELRKIRELNRSILSE